MKKPSVSITGATGFLGWRTCEAFRDAGWHVAAIVRPGSGRPLPEGVVRREAALDRTALAEVLAGAEVAVHLAGVARSGSPRVFRTVNEGGTRAAVDAANAVGARLVLVSSQAVAGPGTLSRPSREDDEPRPLTPYARSKRAAEQIVRSTARVPWTIVRPASVYGPRDRQFLPLFKLASRGILPDVAAPGAAFTLLHVDDAAQGILLASSVPAAVGGTFFLGHEHAPQADELLATLAAAVGRRGRMMRVPAPLLWLMARVGDALWRAGREPMLDSAREAELRSEGFVCSVERARDVLGHVASVPLAAGFAATARWYREAGWIGANLRREPRRQ